MSGRYIEPETFTLIFDTMSDENKEKFIRSENFRQETKVLKKHFCLIVRSIVQSLPLSLRIRKRMSS